MNRKVSVRRCREYVVKEIYDLISDIYNSSGGPDINGKRVLVKPNILSDNEPSRCVSTHPAVVEAMILYLQNKGASVFVGDSPAVHTPRFRPDKSGIYQVCKKTGAEWVNFLDNPVEKNVNGRSIRIASVVDRADIIVSLPKFKNHELMYFTGAIKNTYGIIPGFTKGIQHGIYRDRNSFAEFLVDLTETVTPHYYLMDAITGMEGQGPGTSGKPVEIGLLIGSDNPLALDIVACQVAGYDPLHIPSNKTALARGLWLTSDKEVEYDGPELSTVIKKGFIRIPLTANRSSAFRFVVNRIKILRKLEKRPVFLYGKCTGCHKCVQICPVEAIKPEEGNRKKILLTDGRCIRCYCCAEACQDNAIDIRVKLFGV